MLDTEGAMDIEKLREWAEKSQLDPNDPRNASFFYFIKVRGYTTEKLKCHKTFPVLVNLYRIGGYGLFQTLLDSYYHVYINTRQQFF